MHNKIKKEEIESLRHNARMVVRELGLLADTYQDMGITLAERHLLIEVHRMGQVDIGSVATALILDKSTVSRLIAKAVKKGFIRYILDKTDKRRRLIQLTEKGHKTLFAVEPLAQKQVEKALLALAEEDIHLVHQGVALFAKGLTKARLGKPISVQGSSKAELSLHPFAKEDESQVYAIFQEVIQSGSTFPNNISTHEEFLRCFFSGNSSVFVCKSEEKVLGVFSLKSNFPGHAQHIANASYMVERSHRGQGVGKWLVEQSILTAQKLGFRALQFNLVLSQNLPAVNLYKKLGFTVLGTIPQAFAHADGRYEDAHIMHLNLVEVR